MNEFHTFTQRDIETGLSCTVSIDSEHGLVMGYNDCPLSRLEDRFQSLLFQSRGEGDNLLPILARELLLDYPNREPYQASKSLLL